MALGALIEEVSGEPYEQYVTEHVLQPLGMVHTAFPLHALAARARGSRLASRRQRADAVPAGRRPALADGVHSRLRRREIWFNRFLADSTAPTGLIGPAPEMMRLAEAILNGGALEGRRILSRESVETMLATHQVPAGASPERSAT